jgi:TetR/AcrR family transcriptional regulator, transcriptional repressor for nem operon
MKPSLPRGTDIDAMATFILVTMEGGVMLSRSYRSVEPYDRSVEQLREYFRLLLAAAKTKKAR